jgi:hypothetical protein
MAKRYQVGDKVRLINPQSVHWFSSVGMTIRGAIEKIDPAYYQGNHNRPFLIRFTDGRTGAYARNEIKRIQS